MGNTRRRLYVVDGFGGWEEDYRVPVRVITSRAYHALFMQNMLVPPREEELVEFEKGGKQKPFVIFNAGVFPCNRQNRWHDLLHVHIRVLQASRDGHPGDTVRRGNEEGRLHCHELSHAPD